MENDNYIAILELVAGFYKTSIYLILATAGGFLTISKTLYSTSSYQVIVYLSIGFLLISALTDLGAYQVLIDRALPPSPPESGFVKFLHNLHLRFEQKEIALRYLSGISYGFAIISFTVFIIIGYG